MQVTPAVIHRFLENKCTAEEAAGVQQYLLQHPEALDQWLPDEEWETFTATHPMDKADSNRLFTNIQAANQPKVRSILSRPWIRVAAAAAVAAFVVVVYPWKKPAMQETAATGKPAPVYVNPATTFRNDTRHKVSYTLDDGSVVTLYARSEIICNQPFDNNKRDITLRGKALFKVAKDKARPFTVYAKGFSTTALGTTFRISAYDSSKRSTVKLLEGKVALKPLLLPGKTVYLKPGQSCAFLQGSNTFRRIIPVTHAISKTIIPDPIDSTITESKTEIRFANTPLPAVLKKIAQAYKVIIDPENINLTGRRFTGNFSKQQSLEDVLSTIAGLNNITVSYDGTVYRLSEQ